MLKAGNVLKKIIKGLIFLLILALLFLFAQRVLQAKWERPFQPTAAWDEYESLAKDSVDVLFMGTSQVYSGIDPMLLYEQTGITSYVVSAGGISYDLIYASLQTAVKTQSPKILFLDASSIRYKGSKEEGKIHPLLDQLPISSAKLYYLVNNDVEGLNLLNGLFPFFRYHSRWDDLDRSDFEYALGDIPETYERGHMVSYKSVPTDWKFYQGDPDETFDVPERASTYLSKIVSFCEENGIELVFCKLPTVAWRLKYSNAAQELADELGISYWEMFYENDEIGMDAQTDFRDEETHLNQYGAQKVTHYIGEYLQDHYELADYRGENERWDTDLISYRKLLDSEQ